MQPPNVKTSLREEHNNFTYHVAAYRSLSRDEMLQAIGYYLSRLSRARKRRPMRDGSVTIVTLHGALTGF